jgi:hypothetical protein
MNFIFQKKKIRHPQPDLSSRLLSKNVKINIQIYNFACGSVWV